MRRAALRLALACLPALLVALAGLHLVRRDCARACAALEGRAPCACGCAARHARENGELRARVDRLAGEAGAAILLLLALALGGAAALFAADARRVRRRSAAHRAFVADISHRLRTPLTGLCLNADLLKEGRLPTADARREAVGAVAAAAARLTELVERLLDHVARA